MSPKSLRQMSVDSKDKVSNFLRYENCKAGIDEELSVARDFNGILSNT